jgi:hypothetical protein
VILVRIAQRLSVYIIDSQDASVGQQLIEQLSGLPYEGGPRKNKSDARAREAVYTVSLVSAITEGESSSDCMEEGNSIKLLDFMADVREHLPQDENDASRNSIWGQSTFVLLLLEFVHRQLGNR